ncbi:leukocyte elastase inhibitor-like isoform X1 [Erpetoichthys calabaricus]|uniref:Serpin B6 n=1 Tax=Erpetoichthys calabaricus TaxID=27687 RepID=A0A8C4RPR0_ERPCA|nr:leukocyte elastase inhibitor-like isoform X1 [Erpetoichthys calabaricus]
MESLCSANSQFSLDLFKMFGDKKPTSNIFYSPLSISSAMGMVYLGSKGNTAAEIGQVLHFTSSKKDKAASGSQQKGLMQQSLAKTFHFHKAGDEVHSHFSTLIANINKKGAPYQLSMANRLYGERSYDFVKEYIEKTNKFYHASLESVDFVKAPEESRKNINAWVEKQTNDKIKDLLASGTIDDLTRLVLVNAIYFKGNWEKKFQESSTRNEQFRINKNETKEVKMMHQKSKFKFAFIPEMQCQILELPYVENELSMLILLPKDIEDNSTGLKKLEQSLTLEKLHEWTNPDNMDKIEISVSLPRFKLEQSYDLKEVLINMGVVDAFDMCRADLSGMSPKDDLYLSKAVHKSFVEVNEEGTEAAAATAMVVMMRCAMIPASFNADHPFLFFIRHNKTRSILFYGRFCSP